LLDGAGKVDNPIAARFLDEFHLVVVGDENSAVIITKTKIVWLGNAG